MSNAPTEDEVSRAVKLHLPRGWKLKWKKGRTYPGEKFYVKGHGYVRGIAHLDDRFIESIEPTTYYNLAVFLHECGHAQLGHVHDEGTIDYGAEIEYEAEQYAIKAMRAMGLTVSAKYLRDAKKYVRDCVEEEPDVQHSDAVLKFAYGRKWRDYR